eukprot:scaffold50768_cov54-Phaeocystis_antarctica.AAC.5
MPGRSDDLERLRHAERFGRHERLPHAAGEREPTVPGLHSNQQLLGPVHSHERARRRGKHAIDVYLARVCAIALEPAARVDQGVGRAAASCVKDARAAHERPAWMRVAILYAERRVAG